MIEMNILNECESKLILAMKFYQILMFKSSTNILNLILFENSPFFIKNRI